MIKLDFPFRLISKDNEKISNRQGRFFLSKKFKDWETRIKEYTYIQYHKPFLKGDIKVEIIANFTNKKHCDCFNLPKGLCDALQNCIYKNDNQIKKATIEVIENSPKDSFQVIIQSIKN